MSATLQVGVSTYDLRFTNLDPADHELDVQPLNPHLWSSALPQPPRPDFPRPALNHVVWPVVGLSNHAYGHLLLANEDAATTGTACTLRLTDGDSDAPRDLSLHILARRPLSDTRETLVSSPAGASDGIYFDGWVLTVVDARYLRRRRVATNDMLGAATWGDLISNAGTAAGFTMPSASTINAKIHADLGSPVAADWTVADLVGESYAVVADAAATAVGLRIVVATDGTVSVDAPSDSTTKYTSWLTATGRDTFTSGGISDARYAAPLKVACAEPAGTSLDVALPSPTPRLSDTAPANLVSAVNAFRTKWVETYSNWLNVTSVTGELGGFVLPPVIGTVQHVEYSIQDGWTRIVAVPARYPLPLLRSPGVDGDRVDVWVQTNLCPVLDIYGAPTDSVRVERRRLRVPASWLLGDPVCTTDPTDCCPTPVAEPGWYCVDNVCAYYADRPTGGAGPFASEVACESTGCESGGTPITTSCCPANPTARTLYATFAGLGTVVLRYNTDGWYDPLAGTCAYPIPECDGVNPSAVACLQFMVRCENLGGGVFAWRGGFAGELTPVSVQCDPFELVFTSQPFATLDESLCQATFYTVTVTE